MALNSRRGRGTALFLTPRIGLGLGLIHIADSVRSLGIIGGTASGQQLMGTDQADDENQQDTTGDPGDPRIVVSGLETVFRQKPGTPVPERASGRVQQSDPAKVMRSLTLPAHGGELFVTAAVTSHP